MALRVLTYEIPVNPYMNIAFEEALARCRAMNIVPDTLRIWHNEKSIILGYFRSAQEDINLKEVFKKRYPIVRRFTGGGTVYHDMGCLNYSIAVKKVGVTKPLAYLYEVLLKGVLFALKELGINAETRNTNDIVFMNKKVSGTASSIKWDVFFLHGSILVNADIDELYTLLIIPKEINSSIDPVKYRVANLSNFVNVSHEELALALIHGFTKVLQTNHYYLSEPTETEMKLARLLYEEKYRKPEWNMLRPPQIDREGLERKITKLLS